MPKIESKQVIIDEIKDKLQNASSLVLVDARGITVAEDTTLRRNLREKGVEYKIYKNSMIKFAITETEFEPLTEYLKGPTAIAISYENPTDGPSLLSKATKEIKALEFKAGVVEGIAYDAKGIKVIADIPSREVLLSKFLGSIKSPIGSFARVIKAIADKDETVA